MSHDNTTIQSLDLALQKVLTSPHQPAGFRARLLSKVWEEQLRDVQADKQALEQEHAQALERLRKNHVRMQRDTLAMIVGIAFAAGALAHRLFPWLQSTLGPEAATALPLLAVAIGMLSAAFVLPSRSNA